MEDTGMTDLEPSIYLHFDTNCAEAMRFYEQTLGGQLTMMTVAQAPPGGGPPAGSPDLILHARLSFGEHVLMASDWVSDQPYEGMHGFTVSLAYPSVDEARRVFDALADGGQVAMPFKETFWVEAFGMLTDRFGTPWMINGGKPKMPPQQ
jgi:PhnB protein